MHGASWQRCRVHFARNLLSRVYKGHGEMVGALFRTVFAQTSPREVHTRLKAVAGIRERQFRQAAALLREAGPDTEASMTELHPRSASAIEPLTSIPTHTA
jgi:transposase-like protein